MTLNWLWNKVQTPFLRAQGYLKFFPSCWFFNLISHLTSPKLFLWPIRSIPCPWNHHSWLLCWLLIPFPTPGMFCQPCPSPWLDSDFTSRRRWEDTHPPPHLILFFPHIFVLFIWYELSLGSYLKFKIFLNGFNTFFKELILWQTFSGTEVFLFVLSLKTLEGLIHRMKKVNKLLRTHL